MKNKSYECFILLNRGNYNKTKKNQYFQNDEIHIQNFSIINAIYIVHFPSFRKVFAFAHAFVPIE